MGRWGRWWCLPANAEEPPSENVLVGVLYQMWGRGFHGFESLPAREHMIFWNRIHTIILSGSTLKPGIIPRFSTIPIINVCGSMKGWDPMASALWQELRRWGSLDYSSNVYGLCKPLLGYSNKLSSLPFRSLCSWVCKFGGYLWME